MTAPVAGGRTFLANILAVIAGTTSKPIVRLRQSVAQTPIAHDTATILTFDAEDADTHGFHSTSVNTGRITPTKAGYYRFTATVFFAARADWQLLYAFFRLNGVTQIPPGGRNAPSASASFSYAVTCSATYPMNGTTDYMEVLAQARNAGTASFATVVGGAQTTVFEAEFVRDL
jgi:hypothetical protein